MTTDLQLAALDYIDAGLHILALTGKKPNGRVHFDNWSWETAFYGPRETAEDTQAVMGAFSESKGTTGIAILIPKGMLVADVDTEDAAQLLLDLGWEKQDDSVVSITKNGLHIWFVAPGADRNRWLGQRTLLFKGFGGYVVAPPSLHFAADGSVDGAYEWGANPLVVGGVQYMPDVIPAEVAKRFAMEDQFDASKPDKEAMSIFTLTPVEGLKWWQWPKVWDYNTAGLERAIETAADGNQNNVIHWAAMTAREEGVPSDVAMTRLLAAAERGGHPKQRARDTIKGAYKRAPRG